MIGVIIRKQAITLLQISLKRGNEYLNTVMLSHIHGRAIKIIKEAQNVPTHDNMAVYLQHSFATYLTL